MIGLVNNVDYKDKMFKAPSRIINQTLKQTININNNIKHIVSPYFLIISIVLSSL